MLQIDIENPKTCRECICSCVMPNYGMTHTGDYYTILCRYDMNEHTPLDEKCPLKEIDREMLVCPACVLEVHSDFKTCPKCGAKIESEE